MKRRKSKKEKGVKKLKQNKTNNKTEMNKGLDMLKESTAKVAILSTKLATANSMAEISEEDDGDQKIKCKQCDFNSRNTALFDAHMKLKHGPSPQHICNACELICLTNDELELHLVEDHQDEIDCQQCNAVFKKEADVYAHSNSSCSEIIALNICEKCERSVISKANLKKHIKSCKGKKKIPECHNGDQCRWFKNDKCKFTHLNQRPKHQARQNQQPRQKSQPRNEQTRQPQHWKNSNQEWLTVQPRTRKVLWTCRFCEANIHSREAGRNHLCEMHPNKSVHQQLNERNASQSQPNRVQLWCKFQDKCLKGQSCGLKHIHKDFLHRNPPQNRY